MQPWHNTSQRENEITKEHRVVPLDDEENCHEDRYNCVDEPENHS